MAELGGFGDLPFELGGKPSPTQLAYTTLRQLIGEGLAASDDLEVTTLDGCWLEAIAAGLAAFDSVDEAAHWQGFPSTASDELETYEEILGILPAIEASEEQRRQEVVRRWTLVQRADYPGLSERITAVDSRASLLAPDHVKAGTTIAGFVYDPFTSTAGTFHAGRFCSNYPNHSDDYVVTALLDVGGGVPPDADIGVSKAAIAQLLDDAIPAWCDYRVLLDLGFILDESLLDVTGFGS